MSTLSKLRRLVLRDGVSIREASNRLGISRNTAKKWLDQPEMVEPRYPKRASGPGILGPFEEVLAQWLKSDSHRNKRERRGTKALFEGLRALGYPGSRGPVYTFALRWRKEQDLVAKGQGYVPMHFDMGEAFQFDWSTEYAVIGGLRRRLEVAHTKLAASRAFVLSAYYNQAHEMLFEAHARAFAVFCGVTKRGIYDNMKTAVDKVGEGKKRIVNARFETMTGHYLFDPEFCNRASGWEKGIVEKNVQDRRRGIWREASERRWNSLEELNAWLHKACVDAWEHLQHPEWTQMSIADVYQDERLRLMPNPRPFDGYIEHPARVSSTSLISFQRNRYSVPCEWVNAMVSVRVYHDHLMVVSPEGEFIRLKRCFERDQTIYDWTHYIALIERKPGALRNGAPFRTMPEPLRQLQDQLLRHPGGDRVMAQVLNAVTLHGLEAVLVAAELALQSGRVSAEHVLNVLSRLKEQTRSNEPVHTHLNLSRPSQANVDRYDRLRSQQMSGQEVSHA